MAPSGRGRPGPGWDDRFRDFPESRPLPADGGIATTRQRGAMAERWWSKRFVAVLDSYGLGTRMARGRRYARSGQVLSLEVTPGLLAAQVQGSRRTPYLVTIRAVQVSTDRWDQLGERLAVEVGLAARLLTGELPAELEDVARSLGIELFPTSWRDLRADCNCPDWENPCKHLAAVLYVFADQLDRDPWLLLQWRGRGRDELLAPLEARAGAASAEHQLPVWWPLLPGRIGAPGDGEHRWRVPAATPPEPASAVLARLGPLEVSIGEQRVTDLIAAGYGVIVAGAAEHDRVDPEAD